MSVVDMRAEPLSSPSDSTRPMAAKIVEGVIGQYFENCKPGTANRLA